MLSFDELKKRRDTLSQIDWDLTPQKAFEMYQVKSRDGWKYRNLQEVYHFYIDVYKGKAKVFLMRRGLVHAEDVAEIPVPSDLVSESIVKQTGENPSRGQYPIDVNIRNWIRKELEN